MLSSTRPRCLLLGDPARLRPMKAAAARVPAAIVEVPDPSEFDFSQLKQKIDYVFISGEFDEEQIRSVVKEAKYHNRYVRIIILDVSGDCHITPSAVDAHSLIPLSSESALIATEYWATCLYPPQDQEDWARSQGSNPTELADLN